MSNAINPVDYSAFQRYLEQASGIVLGDNKHYLVNSRLNRILKENKLNQLGELVKILETGRDRRLQTEVVDAMTTNETSWFRDSHPYRILQDVLLPEISKTRRTPVRIWSAACSSGQEPYSISMVIQDYQRTHPGALGSNIQIIATDISSTIIAHAKEARYDKIAIGRGLAEDFKSRYFQKAGDQWEVIEPIRKRIQFRQINLMQSYALLGRFDIIFCRNVLIYFSGEAKQDILERMTGSLNQGGHLVLGGSESPGNAGRHYSMERHGGGMVYKLKS